jgi:hypothetical protein
MLKHFLLIFVLCKFFHLVGKVQLSRLREPELPAFVQMSTVELSFYFFLASSKSTGTKKMLLLN